jgi:ribonuclease HII
MQTPIIHGDRISLSIAAASIIAKVYRDELMERLHAKYEQYDFSTNKGYGTKKHREAIGKYGLCDLHRTSFNLSKFLS